MRISDWSSDVCSSDLGGAGEVDIQYPDEFIDRLHLIWGDAFLSPGGPEEVRAIVSGLDLEDGEVLDIGCGTGGPAIVLARDKGARVTAVDIEPQLLERGRRFAAKAGVADRVDFRLVEPGTPPFAAGRFDGSDARRVGTGRVSTGESRW